MKTGPSSVPERVELEEDEKTRRLELEQGEAALRKQVVDLVMPVFVKANGAVLLLVLLCLAVDVFMELRGNAGHVTLVTSNVLATLIGATTVQLGVLVITIGNYLFPKR